MDYRSRHEQNRERLLSSVGSVEGTRLRLNEACAEIAGNAERAKGFMREQYLGQLDRALDLLGRAIAVDQR